MLLALASLLFAQADQPEARAIEAAQREIEALWNGGGHQIVGAAAPGQRHELRRQLLAVRHPRHCISEIDVRFLRSPVGVNYGSPQKFDWSQLETGGSVRDIRVTFRRRDPPFQIVNGRPVRPPPIPPVDEYFQAPDGQAATRLSEAVRTLVRFCRPI
jgi:hypothetical protein